MNEKRIREILESVPLSLGDLLRKAWAASHDSSCVKKEVGAVLYAKHYGLFTGHGGSRHGCETCAKHKGRFTHDTCHSIHAEMRCILDLLVTSESPDLYSGNPQFSSIVNPLAEGLDIGKELDAVIVVTHGPCERCIALMDYVGIRHVIYEVDPGIDYDKWSGVVNVYKVVNPKVNSTMPIPLYIEAKN